MDLDTLKPPAGAKKKRKRIGCGPGSGHGKTSDQGHKGTAGAVGQYPARVVRRRPDAAAAPHSQARIYQYFPRSASRSSTSGPGPVRRQRDGRHREALLESGLIRHLRHPIKLLADGEIKKPIKVTVHACSKKAKEAVEKAGGQVNLVG